MTNPGIHRWHGVLRTTSTTASRRQRDEFLDEWNGTLQQLRDIAVRVSLDENRPIWLPSGVPAGLQADQFLHAHYYKNVMSGSRSRYEELYETNKNDPEHAITQIINWWHSLPSPTSGELQTLLEWAPVLHDLLSEPRILGLTEDDFEDICHRVWAIQDHALRVANVTVALISDQHYNRATKTKALSKFLYERRSANGSNTLKVIHHVLYDGTDENLPTRLWEATIDGSWRIDHLGLSALGELVGWALPEKFPPRNNRTSKALRSLGYRVTVHG